MDADLKTLFPKTLYILDNALMSELQLYEDKIKEVFKKTPATRNGMLAVDSTYHIDDQLHHDNNFKNLVDQINFNSRNYMLELGFSATYADLIEIDSMWANISYPGDFLFPHVHPNSFISGAFYVKAPAGSKINFFKNINNTRLVADCVSDINLDMYGCDCIPGRLVLFESDFLHATPKQENDEKIVISFNLSLKKN
jgi:uncharacterized protein (TIGR02466 family)